MPRRAASSALLTPAHPAATAPLRAITTMSIGGRPAAISLKASRTHRFTRFRPVAFATFLETVMPIRAGPLLFRMASTTRSPEVSRFPRACTNRYSPRRRSRIAFPSLMGRAMVVTFVYFVGAEGANRARPLARRLFNTARPPGVRMRWRKPYVRFRLTFFG